MVNKVRNDSNISLLKCFHSNRSRGQITCVICPELRKNALFIDQSHASNFALYTINVFIVIERRVMQLPALGKYITY